MQISVITIETGMEAPQKCKNRTAIQFHCISSGNIYIHIHTHTHTHIYIYIHMYVTAVEKEAMIWEEVEETNMAGNEGEEERGNNIIIL